jgi:hypothetical protein
MDAATRAVLNETEKLLIAETGRARVVAAGARQQAGRDSKRAAAR